MLVEKIAIIIVNWNGKNDTLECLASLRSTEFPNFNIVLVDNGSQDDSVNAIKKMFPQTIVIETGVNLGFSGGNNIGISKALQIGASYIFLLNNDTKVDSNILKVLYLASRSLEDKAILGAKIFYHSFPNIIWFAGGKWSDSQLQFEHVGIGKKDSGQDIRFIETDYICGCALFASSKIFQEVGPLDNRFFLTYEDTDFCYRAKKIGYRTFVVPRAIIWHKVSKSFGGEESNLFNYYMARNFLLWAEKHLDKFSLIAVYKKAIIEILCYQLPPRIRKNKNFSLRSRYLNEAIFEYFRSVKLKYSNPLYKHRRRGIIDYCFRRFGERKI